MKKRKRKLGNAIPASIKAEMAQPRMSKSARVAELESDAMRVSQQSRTVMPGTVDKIIQFELRACARQRKFQPKASQSIENSALKIL